MFSHLLEDCREDGVSQVEVAAMIESDLYFLLLKNFKGEYEVPFDRLLEGESLNQAIQRIVIQKTYLDLTEVKRFLCHFDREERGLKFRRLYFVASVGNSEDIQIEDHEGYTWQLAKDAVGYPISDELREAFDISSKY